ncbi:MAG: hypothetical protein ACI87W_001791 [Halieaceae bacterium]|jgi:hypothetical protein
MLIVVLFNLKTDAAPDAYENWAKSTDIPAVNGLGSVKNFSVLRTTGLLGRDDAAPYQYVELLDIADMEKLGEDVATETMQRVAAEFQAFADNPQFMLTESI